MATGILCGLTMGASDLALVSGTRNDMERVRQVLGTRGGIGTGPEARPGELLWDSTRGARYDAYVHLTDAAALRAGLTAETRRLFRTYLTDLTLTSVEVVTDPDEGRAEVLVYFVSSSGVSDVVRFGVG